MDRVDLSKLKGLTIVNETDGRERLVDGEISLCKT